MRRARLESEPPVNQRWMRFRWDCRRLSRYHVARRPARRLFARIQHGLEAVVLPMQQVEPAAAQAGTRGSTTAKAPRRQPQRRNALPPLAKDFLSGFAGERICAGDGALVRNRGGESSQAVPA